MKNITETLIDVVKNDLNEGTDSPYWLILDPAQNMRCEVHQLANQITGPFFSRADANNHLKGRHYNFSSRAVVFCCSGYWSQKYKEDYKSLEKEYRS